MVLSTMTPTQLKESLATIRRECEQEPGCPKARGIIAVLDVLEPLLEAPSDTARMTLTQLASQWLEGKR